MKKRLFIFLFIGTMFSGCYTHICPTYAVKPKKQKEIQAELHHDTQSKSHQQSL